MKAFLAALLGVLLAATAQAQQVPNPISGPATSEMNEITSWNSLYGNALRHGYASITHETPSIAIDGAPFTARNTKAFTPSQILDAAFLLAPGAGAKNYDGMRAVAFAPTDTTINLVNGVSGYVVSDAVTGGVGGFPATVGLFAAGVARGNGAKVWGVNTLLSDTMTGAASAGTGKSLNNEFDFNISSPTTTVLGLQLAGGSKVQPASAYGVVLQPLDLGVELRDGGIIRKDPKDAGTVAKWTAFLQSVPGSTNVFAGLAPKDATGNNIKSQDIVMGFYGLTGTYGNVVLNASAAGGLELYSDTQTARALTIHGGDGGSVRVPDKGGYVVNSRIVMLGDGASFSVGGDANYTSQAYSNPSAITTIYGTEVRLGGVLVTSTPTLIGSVGTLTNGAGASAGTLTNAPAAGNPTKWVVLNDNGVFRYIPTW